MSDINERLANAARQHQAGRFDEAEQLYRGILEADPKHAIALQCLGILGLQIGRPALTIEALGQALAVDDRMPECHHNLALALRAAGRLDEAVTHYRRTLALKPDHVEAHVNLANALAQQSKFEEATASYRRALALKPDFAQAHNNLGTALLSAGRPEEGLVHLQRALALNPSLTEAYLSIGDTLIAQGRVDEAAGQFQRALDANANSPEARQRLGFAFLIRGKASEAVPVLERAIALKPDFIGAYNTLAQALFNLRRVGDALGVLRRAIDISGAVQSKLLFIQFLRSLPALPNDEDLRKLIERALAEPWDRVRNIGPLAESLLKQDRVLRDLMARVGEAWPRRSSGQELLGTGQLDAMSGRPLFVELLKSTPICDVELERLLTALRFILLETAARASPSAPVNAELLAFACAMARQCFLNEYVFAQDAEERALGTRVADMLAAAMSSGSDVNELWLAASASYAPLHSLPVAGALLERKWSAPVADLLVQQVREPQEEQSLRPSIPVLTAVEDTVSLAVQQQYEENPYPRWVKAEPAGKPLTIDQLMRGKFPRSRFRNLGTRAVDILVAGCGTGQQPFEFAQQIANIRLLAVDLSRASLAYAKRKALSGALGSVEYGQGDILKLGSIGRKFDLIVASGVLHHMHDPFAGWRALLALLRPAGVMYVGLYSELARGEVKAARSFIAERGYRATPDDIRRCRQDIMSLADGALEKGVVRYSDFFTLSECRDLLFHVQEHRHTLPQIADFLAQNDLTFLGFDLQPMTLQPCAAGFPGDGAMTDLRLWTIFEQKNPDTFVGMYQFWVQKAAP